MTRLYEEINYALRPAKGIERKMIAEVLHRLHRLDIMDSYRYVGFGSAYFSDFILFHRSLGICDMISIEQDEFNEERFDFNRPFDCVKILYGESTTILPSLDWNKKTILWLDYEKPLDKAVFEDISHFCTNAQPRSLLIITVNANPGPAESREGRLKKNLGEDNLPPNTVPYSLGKWNMAEFYRTLIRNRIDSVLRDRNGTLPLGRKLVFSQLFNFNYADEAKMLTVGGILYEQRDKVFVNDCNWQGLEQYKKDNEPLLIEAPNLTYRELRLLDSQLPTNDVSKIDGKGIPEADLKKYAQVYRYFPAFVEAEL